MRGSTSSVKLIGYRVVPAKLAGGEGFEPSSAGIKTQCHRPLGEAPTTKKPLGIATERLILEATVPHAQD